MQTLNGLPIVIVPVPFYTRRTWRERLRSKIFHAWTLNQHPCWKAVSKGGFIKINNVIYMKREQYEAMIK